MQVDLDVIRMVYGGDALCRTSNNETAFVARCIPGENIAAEIIQSKKNYLLGNLIQINKPAPNRIIPRCKHFNECGGCSYQHLPYSDQLSIKESIFHEQLTRLGKIVDPPISAIIPSYSEWNYRSVMQFHLDSQGRLGFQKQKSNNFVPISECHLPTKGISEFLQNLDFGEGHGIDRLEIREGSDRSLLLTMNSSSPDIPEISCEFPISIIHGYNGNHVLLTGEDAVTYIINGQEFIVSSGSFFQVNLRQTERLLELLLKYLDNRSFSTIMDLYSGVGLFSKFLAPLCQRLIAIEISPAACDDFSVNLSDYEHCELYIGTVASILPNLEVNPDLVILDPPRTGVEKIALSILLKYSPKTMVYISCNPSTLARDLQPILQEGYKIQRIIPIDMFPQTYHIESICFLEK